MILLSSSGAAGGSTILIWIVVLVVFMLIFMVRPQRKEQARKEEMIKKMEVGDTVLTTSGFYGTLIDVSGDTVIVEFGSNKNCRIPMQMNAIAQVEKAEDALEDASASDSSEKTEPETKKKGLFKK